MFRLLRLAALVSGLALLFSLTVAVPSASASTAQTATPVVFVHGFFADRCPTGLNVASAMAGPTTELSATGWTGRLEVVSYYSCDQGGSRIGSDTTGTSIQTIGAQLAWYIHDNYTAHGQAVDIVAHSMGGLVTRAAIELTADKASGFPPSLLVNRVVTFSTPFTGVNQTTIQAVPGLAGTGQATQVLAGSSFLKSLTSAGTPASTSWLTIGSSGGCDVVPGASATGMPGALRILYTGCWTHTQYLSNWTQTRSYPAYLNTAPTMAYGSLALMRMFLALP